MSKLYIQWNNLRSLHFSCTPKFGQVSLEIIFSFYGNFSESSFNDIHREKLQKHVNSKYAKVKLLLISIIVYTTIEL